MIQLFGALIKFKICPKSKQTKLTKVSSVSKKIKEDVQYFLAVQSSPGFTLQLLK